MRRALPWVIAWSILVGLGVLLHWAAWIAPRHEPPIQSFLSEGVFRGLSNLLAVMSTPGWFLLVRVYATSKVPVTPSLDHALYAYAISWTFWLALWWLVLKARDVLGPMRRATPDALASPSRRRLLGNTLLAGGAIAGGSTMAHGTLIAPWQLRVTRYQRPVKTLPAALSGLRVVYISDTHVGPRIPEAFVREAYERAIALKPDLFLLGGDYVHNGSGEVNLAAKLMGLLVSTGKPVIAVLGNHDWYVSGERSRAAYTAAGVRMIDNDRVFLLPDRRTTTPVQPPGECLCIAGVGDWWTHIVDAGAALDGVRPEVPRLVLSHNPDVAELPTFQIQGLPTNGRRVDLMLSGHTHGGQVKLPLIGVPVEPSDFKGKYTYGINPGPAFDVLTSSGVGMSMIPIRVNCPPEIVELTLVSE